MIYNPQEEFDTKLKDLHNENTNKYFEKLVSKSGINIEENRKCVNEYNELKEELSKIKKKFNLWRFLRVLMFITLILIPLVIIKINPKIKELKQKIENADKKLSELLELANNQMAPLNALFTDKDALRIIEETIPDISFAHSFSAEAEADMIINYDFDQDDDGQSSAFDILAGEYNGNPFLFENKIIHKMGTATYHGSKTIRWTETYRDSNGRIQTRTKTQTLHASVTKPKPYYSNQLILNYCAQGGPELSFTRDATHLEKKSEKEIDRYVKKGERRLKKIADDAIKDNKDFTVMSNSDFEVLFDALDRTNEVQFRTLFTPLAQTNIVDLIRSQSGFGDDFNFIKKNRTNKIITHHSQGRDVTLNPSHYVSYSYDIIKDNFINGNTNYFKAIYFDFAPLLAIPIYQERPVNSLKPIPDFSQKYSFHQYEALSNMMKAEHTVHPRTKTQAILKSGFVSSQSNIDRITVSAYSYDIMPRIDFIPVRGGDNYWHDVPVPWDEYIPLEASNDFFVAKSEQSRERDILAKHGELCIFN